MSIASRQSPSRITDDWDALVEREVTHQARIEAAFDCADACERAGYFELALKWLDRASALSGGLSPACREQRARLSSEVDHADR